MEDRKDRGTCREEDGLRTKKKRLGKDGDSEGRTRKQSRMDSRGEGTTSVADGCTSAANTWVMQNI